MVKFYRLLIAMNSVPELGNQDNLDCRVKRELHASKQDSTALINRAARNFR
jgi:hypothetical protein